MVKPGIFGYDEDLICGVSTRLGGVSQRGFGMNLSYKTGDDPDNVAKNRSIFFGGLGLSAEAVAIPGQIHGDKIHYATSGGDYPGYDALLTDRRGLFLAVTIADCTPIFLHDRAKQLIAAVHSGWRGTEKQILGKVLDCMIGEHFSDPGDIYAFIGPSAGACCYRVGEEVAEKFDRKYVTFEVAENPRLDLVSANYDMLVRHGVEGEHIEIMGGCTICNPEKYHSYRRDGEASGRMMGVIGLLGQPAV